METLDDPTQYIRDNRVYDKSIIVHSEIELSVIPSKDRDGIAIVKHQYRSRDNIIAPIIEVADGNKA